MLQSLSAPLQNGVRFLQRPLPAEPFPLITVWIPSVMTGFIGLTQFCLKKITIADIPPVTGGFRRNEGGYRLWSGRGYGYRRPPATLDDPTCSHFGYGVSTPCAARDSRTVDNDASQMFNLLISLRLPSSLELLDEQIICPRSFAQLITRMHVRVGTPGYHRVSLLNEYSSLDLDWSHWPPSHNKSLESNHFPPLFPL